jgi:hypothetical protein
MPLSFCTLHSFVPLRSLLATQPSAQIFYCPGNFAEGKGWEVLKEANIQVGQAGLYGDIPCFWVLKVKLKNFKFSGGKSRRLLMHLSTTITSCLRKIPENTLRS